MPQLRTVMALAVVLCLSSCDGSTDKPDAGEIGDGRFTSIVEKIVTHYNLPALTVVVTRNGEVVESAAVGKRSLASATPVAESDYWQIGSITKGVTATLAARLVELGIITWDTTIEDTFPTYLDQIHPDYYSVTLADLLRHRSGLARDLNPSAIENNDLDRFGYCVRALRYSPAGSRDSFSYSNIGYTVAGVMIEQATGLSWEDALQQFLFAPLEITNYGFGFPDPGDSLLQPIGHIRRTDYFGDRVNDYWSPLYPSEARVLGRLAIMAPAGAIYLSKSDFVKYQLLHLYGVDGESDVLSQDSFQNLHYPPEGGVYAMGWYVMNEDGLESNQLSSDERVLIHNGFVGSWWALSSIIPDRKLSVFIAANSGGGSTASAGKDLLEVVFERLQITE